MSYSLLSHFKGQSGIILLTSGLTGLSLALIVPLLNYFMVTEVKAEPFLAGLSVVSIAASGIVLSLWCGRIADSGQSTKWIYLFGMAGTLITGLIFSVLRDYWFLLLFGTIFMGLAYVSLPQNFTIARQFAEESGKNVTDFNSINRACISFSWIMGPALAYSLVAWFGFAGAFYSASGVALIAILFGLRGLPDYRQKNSGSKAETKPNLSLAFWLLATTVCFANMANMMYNVAIPLVLTQELALHKSLPGWVMGFAAAVEIPAMIFSGRYAIKHGKIHTLKLGMLVGIAFYLFTFFVADKIWHFMLLQILNGTFFGILAGLGITLMQDHLPKHPGFSSAFYTNALEIGTLVGAFSAGVIAQLVDYHSVMLACAVMVLMALISLTVFSKVAKKLH